MNRRKDHSMFQRFFALSSSGPAAPGCGSNQLCSSRSRSYRYENDHYCCYLSLYAKPK